MTTRQKPEESTLTPRELEVLALVCEGKTSKTIAESLFVADTTIHYHLANTYKKLCCRNRMDAVRIALRTGLLPETRTTTS